MTLQQLNAALAGGTPEEKIQAVLALEDNANDATATLEQALPSGDPRLDVAILDALYRINQDPNVEQQLIAILDSQDAQGDAGEEIYMMARTALNRVESKDSDEIEGEGFAISVMGVERREGVAEHA